MKALKLLVFLLMSALCACSMLQKEEVPDERSELTELAKRGKLTPEQTQELLGEVGKNWFYGQGFGETALNVGTIVAFPPYAIYVLGNSALRMNGYKPLQISDALPEADREVWSGVYDDVTSAPGKLNSELAGEEFRDKAMAKERINEVIRNSTAE